MKYGIMSTASIVERYVNGIKESKKGEVVAIASRNYNIARIHADRLGIEKAYGSYEELCQDEEIDVIYIPTMNGIHYENCKMALQHHKHVIVEKPFVLEVEQANELFELAREKGCFLMEGQKSVFLPTTNKLKELLDDGVIGKVKYIELKAGFPGRFGYDHWMYNLKEGGGALYGSATYTIELLQHLFNHPGMTITGEYVACPTGSDDICNFQLKLNNDILVSSTIAMHVALKNEAVFYGDKGYITVPYFWKSSGLILTLHSGEEIKYDFPYKSEFVYEVNHINDCIEKGLLQSPIMNQDKTVKTVELVDKLYKQWNLK